MVALHSVVAMKERIPKNIKRLNASFFCLLESKKATKVTFNILTYQGVSLRLKRQILFYQQLDYS